jgi:hypothetical protein
VITPAADGGETVQGSSGNRRTERMGIDPLQLTPGTVFMEQARHHYFTSLSARHYLPLTLSFSSVRYARPCATMLASGCSLCLSSTISGSPYLQQQLQVHSPLHQMSAALLT